MKKSGFIQVEHNPGEPFPVIAEEDLDFGGMTEEEIEAAIASDRDDAPIPVHNTPGLIHIPNPIRLRKRLALTQEQFAQRYRIPLGTLRDWEQGRKFPDATARAYLMVIHRDPETVARLMDAALGRNAAA